MVYTGKETLKEALTRQDIFNGYDALKASIETLSKSGYGAKAPTLLDSPLMGYSDADIHKEIPAKSELCCAVFIERLKDSGFRGKYPTSMRLAEERIESEIRAISENTSPEYKKELDDCRKYLSGRQAVLEGYLDYVINELYEGATDEYLEEIDPEVFRVEKGASLSETMSALESAISEEGTGTTTGPAQEATKKAESRSFTGFRQWPSALQKTMLKTLRSDRSCQRKKQKAGPGKKCWHKDKKKQEKQQTDI